MRIQSGTSGFMSGTGGTAGSTITVKGAEVDTVERPPRAADDAAPLTGAAAGSRLPLPPAPAAAGTGRSDATPSKTHSRRPVAQVYLMPAAPSLPGRHVSSASVTLSAPPRLGARKVAERQPAPHRLPRYCRELAWATHLTTSSMSTCWPWPTTPGGTTRSVPSWRSRGPWRAGATGLQGGPSRSRLISGMGTWCRRPWRLR